MKPIKIGLVGIGRAGWGIHAIELDSKTDMFEIVAACDVIPERNQKMAEKYGCRTYDSIEELVKDEEVELVSIATRTVDHYNHVLCALNAGKDVLVEKPMTMSYDQAFDLFKRANKPGLPRLFVHQQRRFESMFNLVYDTIKSGKLGKVYEINIEENGFQHRDDWQTLSEFGGGQLLNWGPHIIDHSLQLLGNPVKEFSSELKHIVAGGDCEDHLNLQFKDKEGTTVNMCISGATALNCGRTFTVYGDRGALVAKGNTMTLRYISPDQIIPEVISDPETPGAAFGKTGTYASKLEINWIEETIEAPKQDLTVFWDYLYKSYREGATFPIKDDEILAIMKTISDAKAQNSVK